jgi:predicted Fe-Mo cluster-binding NifX family protein
MRIAVTSQKPVSKSPIDPRFGRAACFLIYDTDTGSYEVVENTQNLQAASGAGIQAAQTVHNHGADAVCTGHCGPKAFRTLMAANIQIYTGASGTVEETIQRYLDGNWSPSQAADVEGHW